MKYVIVTGATSFIGSQLTKELLKKGYFVYALTRVNSNNLQNLPLHSNLIVLQVDLSDLSILFQQNIHVEAFFHFGWDGIGSSGRNDESIQIENVKNTIEAIRIANQLRCKCFIFAGSQAEYGFVDGVIDEKTTCSPQIQYGKAKLEVYLKAKAICHDLKMKYLHLRIFSIYGQNDHEWTLISQTIINLLNNIDMPLSQCNQYWNFMHSIDAVDQIIGLSEFMIDSPNRSIEVYNIASLDTRILKDFIEEIKGIIGGEGKLLYGSINPQQVLSLQPDISKLINDIQWKQKVSFEEGIKSLIKFYGN